MTDTNSAHEVVQSPELALGKGYFDESYAQETPFEVNARNRLGRAGRRPKFTHTASSDTPSEQQNVDQRLFPAQFRKKVRNLSPRLPRPHRCASRNIDELVTRLPDHGET